MSINEAPAGAAGSDEVKPVGSSNNNEAAGEARSDCPACGASNRTASKFCRICGASTKPRPIVESSAPSEPVPPPEPEPEPSVEISAAREPVPAFDPIPAEVASAPPVQEESSSEIEQARRELEAEEERLRALSDAHHQRGEDIGAVRDEIPDEFETVMQFSLPASELDALPRDQAPTEELERALPATGALASNAPVRSALPETMGGAGGLQVEVPPAPVYRSPGRPKTIEATGNSIDAQLSDSAKLSAATPTTGENRSQSYYLGVGAVLGAIVLAILGLIAFVVYWFILSK